MEQYEATKCDEPEGDTRVDPTKSTKRPNCKYSNKFFKSKAPYCAPSPLLRQLIPEELKQDFFEL